MLPRQQAGIRASAPDSSVLIVTQARVTTQVDSSQVLAVMLPPATPDLPQPVERCSCVMVRTRRQLHSLREHLLKVRRHQSLARPDHNARYLATGAVC